MTPEQPSGPPESGQPASAASTGTATDDPGVAQLDRAENDEDRLQIEAELLIQTDNRPEPGKDAPQDEEAFAGEVSFAPGNPADALRERIFQRARSQLGVHEEPFGSNTTPYTGWYGMIGPWCAMFVSWCFFHEGLPLPATTSKGFAYTPSGAAWFQRLGRWTTRPQAGAVIFFDFPGDDVDRISHVGIVESVRPDGVVVCLEGNTNAPGGRTGGMVMRHFRTSGIVGYGLPNYGAGLTILGAGRSAGDEVLRRGSLGPGVADWQKQLNEASGARLEVDGEFGDQTEAATRTFQERQGIEVDGEVGPNSRKAMAEALKAMRRERAPVVAIPPWPGRLLKAGVTGSDVRQWQAQMSKRGHELEIDGEFGPISEEVCRAFQSEQALEVDGVVGEDTWRATFAPQEG